MHVGIVGRGIALTQAINAYVQRKIAGALARHRNVLESVRMRLGDLNGPKGGRDKHCVLEVRARSLRPIVVREQHADLYAAIDRAAVRMDASLARQRERRRSLRLRSIGIGQSD